MGSDAHTFKQQAAQHAVSFIESGMVVGLGHGSTSRLAVHALADRMKKGEVRDIVAIPCSLETEAEARELGITMTTLEDHPRIDITVDGADEVDPRLNLIKGGGGALLREKIVAQASRREIIMVDESKLSVKLGTKWAVPVEVLEYGLRTQLAFITSLGASVTLRMAGIRPFQTADGNVILDCNFGPIGDPVALSLKLNLRSGIIGHGIFIGMATEVVVAGIDGVRVLTR
jgi:ribose 5-phosphate isomerase A